MFVRLFACLYDTTPYPTLPEASEDHEHIPVALVQPPHPVVNRTSLATLTLPLTLSWALALTLVCPVSLLVASALEQRGGMPAAVTRCAHLTNRGGRGGEGIDE